MLIVTDEKLPFKPKYAGAEFDLHFRSGDLTHKLRSLVKRVVFIEETLEPDRAKLAAIQTAGQLEPELYRFYALNEPPVIKEAPEHLQILIVTPHPRFGSNIISGDDYTIHFRADTKYGLMSIRPDIAFIQYDVCQEAISRIRDNAQAHPAFMFMFSNINHLLEPR